MADGKALSELDVRREMKKTLMEWGVRREYNQSHARFYDRAMSKALVYSKASSVSAAPTPEMASLFLDLKDEDMPEDPKEAILYVLISELEGYEEDDSLSEIRDILDMGTAPFFEWTKKFGDAEVTKIKRRWGFEKCSFDALDPLKRFYVERFPVRQYYYERWHDRDSLGGYVFEALVAHHMVHSMPCQSCKYRNCLRWNGGFHITSSWMDVVCLTCRASYEIKSKASDEKIDQHHKRNSFHGGSFRTYYGSHRAASSTTQYLVVVSRGATYHARTSSLVHRVDLAEVHRVIPRLCPESFVDAGSGNNNGDRMSLSSAVSIRQGTLRKSWCHVPALRDGGTDAELRSIAKDAFDDAFGPGAWAETAAELAAKEAAAAELAAAAANAKDARRSGGCRPDEGGSEEEEEEEDVGSDDEIAQLRKSLDALKVARRPTVSEQPPPPASAQSPESGSHDVDGANIGDEDGSAGGWEDIYEDDCSTAG